jgi:WD40-like Beta Propeller Repeat
MAADKTASLTIQEGEETLKLRTWSVVGFIVLLGIGLANAQLGTPPWPWYQAKPVNMGPAINNKERDAEVSFLPDGKTMYYNCSNRIPGNGNDICISYFVDGEWTTGEVVGLPISTKYSEVEPVISSNGNRLTFQSDRPGGLGGMDIWVSEKVDGVWLEPVNMGAPINSPYNDHCLYYIGPDENSAYLTSTRPGGYGGNDIYIVHKVAGIWQEPINLGANVNSAYSDHHGMASPDGNSIYFTSDRPGGLGGEDIYVSTMDQRGVFGPAVNVTPLNSDKNDRCPVFTSDKKVIVFDSERDGGYGNKDLWWMYYANIENIKYQPVAVSGFAFSPTVVKSGGTYIAIVTGSNLTDKTYFDLRFRVPGSTVDMEAFNWQQGTIGSHKVTTDSPQGVWTITAIRVHVNENDHYSDAYSSVSVRLTVTP